MRAYVEANFVLELVFDQEQASACQQIVALSESGQLELAIPAISLVEPQQRVRRRTLDRGELRRLLERERNEVERSVSKTGHAGQLAALAQTLLSDAVVESERLAGIRRRLLLTCRVLPIDEECLRGAAEHVSAAGLSLEDAIVLESVRRDVPGAGPDPLFLTRDKKDFNLPEVQRRLGCRIIFDFADGLSALRHGIA